MKTIILLLFPIFCLSQNSLSVGAVVSPMLHTQEVRNLQDFSMTPNLILSYGGKDLQLLVSLGAISKFGTLVTTKHLYCGMYYVVNTITPKVEHGAEIEIGYNKNFGNNMRFFAGVSVGMLVKNEQAKVNIRPFTIGFTFKIFSK